MKIVPAVILGLVLTASGLFPRELPAEVRERALKVIRLLESIDGAREKAGNRARTAVVDEPSLNAFIAFMLAAGDDPLQDLVLKLFPRNRLEGRAVILLKGDNVPAFLQSPLPFLFSGRLESTGGRARVHFQSLYLHDRPIQPALVDLITALASGGRTDPGSSAGLSEWYELPHGIQEIEIRKGALVLRY